MNPKFKPYMRLFLLFGLYASIAMCNPFLSALHSLALDTVSGAQDFGIILVIVGGGLAAFSGGGIMRSGGFVGCLFGAFIALAAPTIVAWLRSLGGV